MTAGTETEKNHGEYVSSMGGGKIAAQKCNGMPLNSKQGKYDNGDDRREVGWPTGSARPSVSSIT